MKFNKFIILIVAAFVLSSFSVYAAVGSPMGTIGDLLGNIFSTISTFFMFKWLDGGNFIGFLRFMMWITVFSIFYAAGQVVFGRMYAGGGAGRANRSAIMIALIFATATVVFTPNDVLATMFESYAVVVLFLLLAVPIGAIVYIIYPLLGQAIPGGGWGLRIARICGLLLIWWILFKVSTYGDAITGTISYSSILFIPLFRRKK